MTDVTFLSKDGGKRLPPVKDLLTSHFALIILFQSQQKLNSRNIVIMGEWTIIVWPSLGLSPDPAVGQIQRVSVLKT